MINPNCDLLLKKYNITAYFYDFLDSPWELQYRRWRHLLCENVTGEVLEVGVGTGRNIPFYSSSVNLTGVDLNLKMLKAAKTRATEAICQIRELKQEDATVISSIPSQHYDWLISSFMLCVMSDDLQKLAIEQFQRILKPGAHFRILDLVYSKNIFLRLRQRTLSRFAEKIYGARYDRPTLENLSQAPYLQIDSVQYVHRDILRIIEGRRL